MERIIITLFAAVLCALNLPAQDMTAADKLIGTYSSDYGNTESKIEITKSTEGLFTAKVIWCKDTVDESGNKILDVKNPKRSLRNVPIDKIVLMWDLSYNPDKNRWDGGRIYDPTRGLIVSGACEFVDDNLLEVRGTIMGIGETLIWKKID